MFASHKSSVRSGLYDKDPHKKIYMKTHTFCYYNLSEICRLKLQLFSTSPRIHIHFISRILQKTI